MAQMACNVYVLTEEGSPLLLTAGSTPPEWAIPQLGAHTLTEPDTPVAIEEPDDEEDEPETPEQESTIPPVKGRGSSAKAWADYALSHGYEVDETAKASEIRAALEEAGIPIE